MKNYTIRLEEKADYREVENLTREAFWNQSVMGCDEHYLVHVMRTHEDFIPELALVLELDGRFIANVMYTKTKLVDEIGEEKQIVSFGPICVHPDFKRQGYGKALLEYSFEKVKELGYDVIVIFGNPDNYVARGLKSSKRFNVSLEDGIFPAALLVKELEEGVLAGKSWTFHESAVGALITAEAAEEFDKQFPPKEKKWQPSQEEFYIHSHSTITW